MTGDVDAAAAGGGATGPDGSTEAGEGVCGKSDLLIRREKSPPFLLKEKMILQSE